MRICRNGAKVTMENFNIYNTTVNANHTIEIFEGAILTMKNCQIKNNKTKKSIFHVTSGCCLNLYKTIFEANLITVKFKQPSCVLCQADGSVKIMDCEFLDHYFKKCPFSAELVKTEGNLFISSSNFENNFANYGLHTISIVVSNSIFS